MHKIVFVFRFLSGRQVDGYANISSLAAFFLPRRGNKRYPYHCVTDECPRRAVFRHMGENDMDAIKGVIGVLGTLCFVGLIICFCLDDFGHGSPDINNPSIFARIATGIVGCMGWLAGWALILWLPSMIVPAFLAFLWCHRK